MSRREEEEEKKKKREKKMLVKVDFYQVGRKLLQGNRLRGDDTGLLRNLH